MVGEVDSDTLYLMSIVASYFRYIILIYYRYIDL